MEAMTLEQIPEALRGLAKVIRQHGTCAPMALEKLADAITAHLAQPAQAVDVGARDFLGKLVRMEWVLWAREQPNAKPSWLLTWDQLTEPEREVDRRIGERIYRFAIDALHEPTRALSVQKAGPVGDGAWPHGCKDANSCAKHRACLYTNCRHADSDITAHLGAEQ